jgi:hypothetical protein
MKNTSDDFSVSPIRQPRLSGGQIKKTKITQKGKILDTPQKPNFQKTTVSVKKNKDSMEAMLNKHNVTIVLLTWQRLSLLKKMLLSLRNQSYQNFNIRITNANLEKCRYVENVAKMFDGSLDIEVSHEGNDQFAFRRFSVGKDLAENGTDIILFIDDDVEIPNDYVEQSLRYYENKSYKSGFAWKLNRGGSDYYKYRTRVYNTTETVNYCGTGMSMIDASIFLDSRLISQAPPEAIKIEDLWLSYFAQRVLGWKLSCIPVENVILGGSDSVALYKQILKSKNLEGQPDKSDFLRLLVKKYKWKL